MANTLTLESSTPGQRQFQGSFNEVWKIRATIDDQDAVSANDTARFSITVPGLAVGDMVIGYSVTNDLSDGTDQANFLPYVSAANTLVVDVTADVGAYAADDLNGSVVRVLVGRPNW